MNLIDVIQLISALIFIFGIFILIYVLRRKDEKKVFVGYDEIKTCDYLYMPRYRALIETDMGSAYQTHLIHVYILEDEIVLHKEGFLAVSNYSIRFNASNLILLKYKKVSSFKTQLVIYHTEKGMTSPYKVMVVSRIKDESLEVLERLCERVRNNDC